MNTNASLRLIPGVSELLNNALLSETRQRLGEELVTYCIRNIVARTREGSGNGSPVPSADVLAQRTVAMANEIGTRSLIRMVNATGIVIHTNLGRAPMGKESVEAISRTLTGYCNLEFDLSTGKRGHRGRHLTPLLAFLTGAEDAVVVNNNAAALILALNTFAKGREVIVSRGELIEIGGAFRIPDILRASGARMVEVGTTNRTRLSDFQEAIGPKTAMILKAHTSNYAIHGFTEQVSAKELAGLARSRNILFIYDIGSGLLRKVPGVDLRDEPDVQGALRDGCHLVTFSGDKLLCGPQAGVIVGEAPLMAKCAKAPLMRALRVGKLTVAALEAACACFLRGRERNNPLFSMIRQTPDDLRARAQRLCDRLEDGAVPASVVESSAQTGGGSLPDLDLQSFAVQLEAPWSDNRKSSRWAESVFHALLDSPLPVLGVLRKGRIVLDVFTLADDELPLVVNAVVNAVPKSNDAR